MVHYAINVTNTGHVDADDVSSASSPRPAPERAVPPQTLFGFERTSGRRDGHRMALPVAC